MDAIQKLAMSVRPKPITHTHWLREALDAQAAHVRAVEASGELAALNARVPEAPTRCPKEGPQTVAGKEVANVVAALEDTSGVVVPAERAEAERAAHEIMNHMNKLYDAMDALHES